jgi:hypothetical protein
MSQLGSPVLMPFLQDVIQFFPLARTLLLAELNDPLTPFRIVPHVGIPAMLDFFGHFWNLFLYTMLSKYVAPLIESRLSQETDASKRFHLKRLIEAWQFGAGLDYH